MTTIVTKNGSGAPLASDLVQGELAVDLTNKRLYTEDSGGTVIEVGTNPSTIDINAGTIDGTVIGGSSAAAGTFTTFTSTGIDDNATSTAITIDSSENVGIGTSSPSTTLEVSRTSNGHGLSLIQDATNAAIYTSISFKGSTGAGYNTVAQIRGYQDLNAATGYMTFLTSSSERMRIDSSGRVGIGTTSPDALIDIRNSSGVDPQIKWGRDGLAHGSLFCDQFGTTILEADTTNVGANSSLQFHVDGTERMRITSSGNILVGPSTVGQASMELKVNGSSYAEIEAINFGLSVNMPLVLQRQGGRVGIGTSSPSKILELSGTNSGSTSDSPAATLRLTDTDTSTATDQPIGKIEFYGNDGTVPSQNVMAYILSKAASTSGGGDLRFGVCNFSSASEAMRIDSSGNLLVGKTSTGTSIVGHQFSPSGVSTHVADNANLHIWNRLTASGTMVSIQVAGVQVGSISTTASATAYNTSSDQRLKENIVDAPAGNIDAIRVRSFDWKADGSHQTYGMVAQELVDVAPEAVSQGATEDDMWAVDYSKLVPMMIKEIQDLRARVAQLEGA